MTDAGVAAKGMRLLATAPKAAAFDSMRGLTFVNSDLAFRGNMVYQGNFAGFTIWDVSNPTTPTMMSVVPCITSQGDPSIIGNLLFVSAEGGGNRNDCAKGGVQDPNDHMAGVRIYDVSEPAHAAAREERADVQGVAHAHRDPASEGQGDRLHLRLGERRRARPRWPAVSRAPTRPTRPTRSTVST